MLPSELGLPSVGFLGLLRRESNISFRRVLVMAALSGFCSTLILAVVLIRAEQDSLNQANFRFFSIFAIALILFIVSHRALLVTTTAEVEKAIHRIRSRLADKIRRTDLLPLERIGRADVYAGVTRETLTISDSVVRLIMACQAAILVVCTLFYVATLSLPACLLLLVIVAVCVATYVPKSRQALSDLNTANESEGEVFDAVTHFLEGFKEVKMSERRSAELLHHTRTLSAHAAAAKVKAFTTFAHLQVFAVAASYSMMGALVFVLPRMSPTYSDIVVRATAAVLFLVGPLGVVVGSLRELTSASVAADRIERLEKLLDQGAESAVRKDRPWEDFSEIVLDAVTFQFPDTDGRRGFTLGPVDLTIASGETIFLIGGNGSGKSTLLKVITALYHSTDGVVRVDGEAIDPSTFGAYRSLFSAVFSDYHLFDRLYGLDTVTEDQVQTMLRKLQLEDFTTYANGRFDTLDLSSGQRKRLALLVTLLEDRPVYVFDEWAAEQDADFRKYFYDTIVRDLKKSGKTVIVVTHDDRYYDLDFIDRVIRMEDGRLQPYRGDSKR